MYRVAWRMLVGDRAKTGAMVFGITFAAMLISQQCSIFCGVMRMCVGQIRDVEDAPVWVLAPQTRYIDGLAPLPDRRVDEVRAVLLGLMVGVAITGHSFYTFTLENLPQFGTLKAMGVTDRRLAGRVLLQAAAVGSVGYGLGVGLAAAYGELTRGHSKLVFFMPWQVLVLTAAAVLLVTAGTSLVSIRRVVRQEPGLTVR